MCKVPKTLLPAFDAASGHCRYEVLGASDASPASPAGFSARNGWAADCGLAVPFPSHRNAAPAPASNTLCQILGRQL